MKHFYSIIRKSYSIVAVAVICLGMSSCEVMMGIAEGMANYPTYGVASYPTYSTTGSYTTGYNSAYTSASSSSYTASHRTCSRCGGSKKCQTCSGTGKKYDYGTSSLITHEKYVQRCGVCNGTGRCGVCDGKGSI